jgi:hypothetical protein
MGMVRFHFVLKANRVERLKTKHVQTQMVQGEKSQRMKTTSIWEVIRTDLNYTVDTVLLGKGLMISEYILKIG